MTGSKPDRGPEWTPATSEPGELYTVEGRSRATWSFLSGAKRRDKRGRAYRRSMMRSAMIAVGLVVVVIVVVAGIAALIG